MCAAFVSARIEVIFDIALSCTLLSSTILESLSVLRRPDHRLVRAWGVSSQT